MVSRVIKTGVALAVAVLSLLSCDRPFVLDLDLAVDSHEYNISSKAGQARFFFYTNRSWTLSMDPAACSWASVDKTSGDGKAGVEEILFTYRQNMDIDREATLVIKAGGKQESVKFFQPGLAKEWWDGSVSVDDLVVKPQY